jgi:hypothetical protein
MIQRQGLIKGTATGLQLWLLFLLALFWLGYSAPVSIVLGAIAGFCGGTIANWLQSKDEEKQPVVQADPDIQVEAGEIYQPSALKQYALRRKRQKEWHKRKWNQWKSWQVWKKPS